MRKVDVNREHTMDRHMMATKAMHKLGDISRDEPDLCRIYAEDGDDWIGSWVTGFGFFDVHFPKATTRPLTPEEVAHFEKQSIQIASHPPMPIKIKQ